ncbi:hypothetical protein SH1V18_25970 [Vallitalea longa]|uniref:Uncharacterized protein n=1 Tax=Vallitalea longa TaxID=2936439 RepID=A0A9W5YAX2_9FIRM|nr:hypothetical protein [Vallitalea longa]GKX30117.1 hypothetical protein SH1V18_25970 [Vallitalea longa]
MFKKIESINKYRITLIILIICIITLVSSISKTKNLERSQLNLFCRNFYVYDEISNYIRSIKQNNIAQQIYYLTQIDDEIFNSYRIYSASDFIKNMDSHKYIYHFILCLQLYIHILEDQYFNNKNELLDFDKITIHLYEISLLIKDFHGRKGDFDALHNTIVEYPDIYHDNAISDIYLRVLDGETIEIEDVEIPYK